MMERVGRLVLGAGLALVLAGCGGGGEDGGAAAESAAADSSQAAAEALGPGVTVDTQRIEDSTVAEMYVPEDSAGG